MNRNEIEKMISLADDCYVEEIFTTKIYERKPRFAGWIAAAAAAAVAVGAAGFAMNYADGDKVVTELQDMIAESETDASASVAESAEDYLSYRINRADYFKNEPDDEAEFYYTLLDRYMDFTSDGPVYRFSAEYLDSVLLVDREDFLNIEGGLQCGENGDPLYADIRLFNGDTDDLPMAHLVFYKDGSHFDNFDKSRYTPELFGDTELYGFDFSENKDGSKLMACWEYGDANYMFTSRGLGFDKFIEVISPYVSSLRDGEDGLKYADHFTLGSFDLNSKGVIKAVSGFKGGSEMNRGSVFAGYVPDCTPFAGLHLVEDVQNYDEVSINGEAAYKRYCGLYIDPLSYDGRVNMKVYISLIYEWGEDPDSDLDTVDNSPVIPFEEITPEKLDEIRIDEDHRVKYRFVIPVNGFTITVNAACERRQLLEFVDEIKSPGENTEHITLAEANAETPFAGYVPQSPSVDGLELTMAVRETSDPPKLRIRYSGEEIKGYPQYTEYVHLYYSSGVIGYSSDLPTVSLEDITAEKLEEIKYFGDSKTTKHSFYAEAEDFHIRAEALCPSEKLMRFFEDMPNLKGAEHTVGDTVRYGDRTFNSSDLSEETLEWLDWYNSLSEEERLAVSYEPAELSD
ncbi:MAG: hypothetical protein NC395_11720 [Prevotella sp.]|nr:hypothetical protein [Prevotella sp.]